MPMSQRLLRPRRRWPREPDAPMLSEVVYATEGYPTYAVLFIAGWPTANSGAPILTFHFFQDGVRVPDAIDPMGGDIADSGATREFVFASDFSLGSFVTVRAVNAYGASRPSNAVLVL